LAGGNIFRFESLVIDPLLQLLAGLEKWKFLRFDSNLFAGFGIPASVGSIYLSEEGAQSPDFNPFPFRKRIGHSVEKDCYNSGSLWFGQISGVFQGIDQLKLVHGTGATGVCFFGSGTVGE
jgi:hypothetical protein